MRAAKKNESRKTTRPHSKKGATLLRIRSLRKDNNKRAFTNASGKKNESRKTTRPRSKKGATLLRIRSLQKTTINAR